MAQPVGMEGVTATNPSHPYKEPAPPQYNYPQVVVETNPGPHPMSIERAGDQVQDNLAISIVSIFFCFILGIAATITAQQSKDNVLRGNIEQARHASLIAKRLAIAAIICGCLGLALFFFFYFFLPLVGFSIAVASA